MTGDLQQELIRQAGLHLAERRDPTHDLEHHLRVMRIACYITGIEGGDIDIVVPAALFHDVMIYPKHGPEASDAPVASAAVATSILESTKEYPKAKIAAVSNAIKSCSFSSHITAQMLEAQILQDSDGLEATGAIAIMRTFAYTGLINRPFYDPADPFAGSREPDSKDWALDLFFTRLLVVEERMHTITAQRLARRRTRFLRTFLNELEIELAEA